MTMVHHIGVPLLAGQRTTTDAPEASKIGLQSRAEIRWYSSVG